YGGPDTVAANDTIDFTVARTPAGEAAGTYGIVITLGTNPNYMITTTPGTFTIVSGDAIVVDVAMPNPTTIYNGTAQTPTGTYTTSTGSYTVTVEYDAADFAQTNAGSYTLAPASVAVSFNGTTLASFTYTVNADGTVTPAPAAGNDATIFVNLTPGTFKIDPRPVAVSYGDYNGTYTGSPHTTATAAAFEAFDEANKSGLVNGAGASAPTVSYLTDDGSAPVEPGTYTRTSFGQNDPAVTLADGHLLDNYTFHFSYGKAVIAAAGISSDNVQVNDPSFRRFYNGTTSTPVVTAKGQNESDTFNVTYSMTEDGTYTDAPFSFKNVADTGNGTIVFYRVESADKRYTGTLQGSFMVEIMQRTVDVTYGAAQSYVYNGSEQSHTLNAEYEILTDLPGNPDNGRGVLAGEASFVKASTLTAKGTDVNTEGYVYNRRTGTLEVGIADEQAAHRNYYFNEIKPDNMRITPRTLNLVVYGGQKDYDGTPLMASFTTNNLVDGHDIDAGEIVKMLKDGSTTYTRTYKGETDLIAITGTPNITITKGGDNTNLAGNYNISVSVKADESQLIVKALTLYLQAGSSSNEYTGKPLTDVRYGIYLDANDENTAGWLGKSGEAYDLTDILTNLVDGHTLTAEVVGSQTDAGTSPNQLSNIQVLDGGKTDLAANGSIIVLYKDGENGEGTLTVTRRIITFTANSGTFTGGGTFTVTGFTRTAGSAVEGETLNLDNLSASG
ncbi:hypothetical protein LJC04_06900, partial [Ruminococcaceae bacterium OttesenSCG-928-O06]|nr:hypothetical protein [Ruminococcaceae bacterium OttesenSCG-928-O06]